MKDYALTASNPSQKPRKKQGKRRPLLGILLLLKAVVSISAVSLIIFCVAVIPDYLSKPIDPTKIAVKGNKILDADSLLERLKLKINSPWNEIDPFELSVLLSKHPWISHASVHKTINRGLSIAIKERVPIAYLKIRNDMYLLGDDNRVLSLITSGGNWDLYTIVNDSLTDTKPGDFIPKFQLSKVKELVEIIRHDNVLKIDFISEIDISDPFNIVLTTIPHGIKIKMGTEGFKKKLINLKNALPVLTREQNNLRFIDLRYSQSVVFRRKV